MTADVDKTANKDGKPQQPEPTTATTGMIIGKEDGGSATTQTEPKKFPAGYIEEAFHPKEAYTRERGSSVTDIEVASSHSTTEGPQDKDEGSLAGTNVSDQAVLPPPLEIIKAAWFELVPYDFIPSEADILEHDVRLLHQAHHSDPFSVLGPHWFECGGEELSSCVVR